MSHQNPDTPNTSRSKSRKQKNKSKPFQIDSQQGSYNPNPIFAPSQLSPNQFGGSSHPFFNYAGYMPMAPPPPPSVMQTAYNEFRCVPSPSPSPVDAPATDLGDDDNSGPESVPETQQSSGRRPTIKWTIAEEVALAKAWIHISEDARVGNAQKRPDFYRRVLAYFLKEPNVNPRQYDQINSKWNKMNTKVQLFNGIYNRLSRGWQSGQSDADIRRDAGEQYMALNNGKAFPFEHVWEIVKDSPKWNDFYKQHPNTSRSEGSSKRSRTEESPNTPSDARVDLDTDSNDDGEPIEPRRPMGNKKGKKAAQTSSSSQTLGEVANVVDRLEAFETKMSATAKELMDLKWEKEKRKAFDILFTPEEGLAPDRLEMLRARKAALMKKYGDALFN